MAKRANKTTTVQRDETAEKEAQTAAAAAEGSQAPPEPLAKPKGKEQAGVTVSDEDVARMLDNKTEAVLDALGRVTDPTTLRRAASLEEGARKPRKRVLAGIEERQEAMARERAAAKEEAEGAAAAAAPEAPATPAAKAVAIGLLPVGTIFRAAEGEALFRRGEQFANNKAGRRGMVDVLQVGEAGEETSSGYGVKPTTEVFPLSEEEAAYEMGRRKGRAAAKPTGGGGKGGGPGAKAAEVRAAMTADLAGLGATVIAGEAATITIATADLPKAWKKSYATQGWLWQAYVAPGQQAAMAAGLDCKVGKKGLEIRRLTPEKTAALKVLLG